MVNLAVIRAALLPQSELLRKGLLAALGIVAILAGLLAMHTLSASAPSHIPVAGVAEMDHHLAQPVAMPVTQAASDECASGCEPVHAMGLMACLLVLMTVSMIVVAMSPAARWFDPKLPSWRQPVVRIFTASPSPPSLEELSISRT
jgi:hypothetical protein